MASDTRLYNPEDLLPPDEKYIRKLEVKSRSDAARIAALEAELAEARAQRDRLEGQRDFLAGLKAPTTDMAVIDRAIAAEARAEKLAEALMPFGDVDGEGDEDFPDDTQVIVQFGRTTFYAIVLSDFRKARAALGGDYG